MLVLTHHIPACLQTKPTLFVGVIGSNPKGACKGHFTSWGTGVFVSLQALCAEASLAALRRVYPQVYDSDTKLLINPDAVVVIRQDFMTAMQGEGRCQPAWGQAVGNKLLNTHVVAGAVIDATCRAVPAWC